MFEQNVFRALADWQAQGLKTGLATLVAIDGSSPRPLGAQIGVAEDGRHCGVISSGCAEDAIIAETLRHMADGTNQITRYGKGSPYIDVTLPCGSGLDILFNGDVDALVPQVTTLHNARKPAFLQFDRADKPVLSDSHTGNAFIYEPDFILHVFGNGPQMIGFAQLAQTLGYHLHPYSTDDATLSELNAMGVTARQMSHQTMFEPNAFDEYSAVITLFHEHNLELNILHAALSSDAPFIGAMGSKKTHAQRLDILKMKPPTKRPPTDIHGPVGLDIGASDPAEIALSILAQIVQTRRKQA
jgi:xanthine dehydrogenase accessory factor